MFEIRSLRIKDKKELLNLLKQLTDKPIKLNITSLVRDKKSHCLILESDGKVVGFGSLMIHQVPSKGFVARIEDVIVHKDYRGKGYGRKITQELISIAKKKKIKSINLTSNPKRAEARKLYQSMGFELLETGVFRLEL